MSGAKIYALYVIDLTPFGSILMDDSWVKNACAELERVGREAICCIERNAKAAGVEAAPIILKGNPAEKILDFAENQKVDMIVMGSTGKSGIKRFMLGSVSEKVVRHSKSRYLSHVRGLNLRVSSVIARRVKNPDQCRS